MLTKNNQLIIRSVRADDRPALASLIHFARYVHGHLDWRKPLDWMEASPFLIGENERGPVAALACPPDPPKITWVRLFAVASTITLESTWGHMWSEACLQLADMKKVEYIVAIPFNLWFRELLEASNFTPVDRVVVLMWSEENIPDYQRMDEVQIRKMRQEDLSQIEKVDRAAFAPLWHNSIEGLTAGFQESALATIAENASEIVAYQISTATSHGGHLARLAVLPEYQNHGFGSALLKDTLMEFRRRRARSVTVNTQISNPASLALYEKMGFHRTGEEYPVMQYFRE